MNTDRPSAQIDRPSAQICVFPARGRLSSLEGRAQKFAAMEAAARRYAGNVQEDGWYHDDAIAEAGRPSSGFPRRPS